MNSIIGGLFIGGFFSSLILWSPLPFLLGVGLAYALAWLNDQTPAARRRRSESRLSCLD